jgi:hypothetical protein
MGKNRYVQLLENKVRELENAMRQDQPVNLVPPTETNLSIVPKVGRSLYYTIEIYHKLNLIFLYFFIYFLKKSL